MSKEAFYFQLAAPAPRIRRSLSEDDSPRSCMIQIKANSEDNRNLQKYFLEHFSKSTNDSNNNLYDKAHSLSALMTLMKTFNIEMLSFTDSKKEYTDRLKKISHIICNIKKSSKSLIRQKIIKNIAALNYAIEYTTDEIERTRQNIARTAFFHKIISNSKDEKFYDIQEFVVECVETAADTAKLYKLLPFCEICNISDDGEKDFISDLTNPESKNGLIVSRYLQKLNKLTYQDFLTIVDALSEEYDFDEVHDYLFGLAWQRMQYPFTCVIPYPIPEIFTLTPKIFNPPYIGEPWISTPFNNLSESKWPLRPICDSLLQLLFEINPFSMADCFWNTLQLAGKVIADIRGDDKEVDFDELFTIMLVAIFATCQRSLMQDLAYAISFGEEMQDQPQRKFAVSHMEGLYVHILHINPQEYLAKYSSD